MASRTTESYNTAPTEADGQPRPVNFFFCDPAKLRLSSSSDVVGAANARDGTVNAASVAINSGT